MANEAYKPPSILDYNRFGTKTPNWAADMPENINPVPQTVRPQPVKPSPVRATLPIPQTQAKAPNVSMPDVNVQPLVGQKPNVLPDVTAPDLGIQNYLATRNQGAEQARLAGGRTGELAYAVRNNPVTDAVLSAGNAALSVGDAVGRGAADLYGGIANFGKGVITGDYTPIGSGNAAEQTIASATNTKPAPTAAAKATPAQPAASTVKPVASAPAKTETTIAQNTQAKPAPTNTGVPKPSKPAKAGKPSANPAAQTQPQAQAPVDVGADPYAAYKARTGIDLSNTSFAPVPSYVEKVNQTQGMDFQNGKPANVDGSAVVPVESQEQFNQRWAQIQDFYNSPEGQAVVAARQQGDVVEVQRGDKVSYTDLRNGGGKGIQDFIADQAAKDSALAKSPTSPMNNRELNQLDLLKPKLASETDIAQTGIAANASRDVASINNADEAVKTALLKEYMNPNTDAKRKEQLAPLFTSKDNKEIVVQGGEVYNEDSGQMQKVPSYVYDPSIKDYRYPNGAKPNTASGQSKLLGKPATKGGKPLPEGMIVNDGGVKLQVVNGVLQLAN